jgi:aminopeptidase
MYKPGKIILKKYADVLIKFALNSGQGVKKDEVVLLWVRESAKPILEPLQKAVLEADAHYITYYVPEGTDRRNIINKQFFKLASEEQVEFFPGKFFKGLADQIDHQVEILSEADPHLLEKIDSKKIMQRSATMKPWLDWRSDKEYLGKFTWVLGLYGTAGMAREAGLSLKAYWDQIVNACFLDKDDPIKKWKETAKEIDRVRGKLNLLKIKKLHVEAKNTDLWITMGEKRRWLGGAGRNIPSFEIFTSPDCRFTEGTISFNQPLYSYGNLIKDIQLWFERGRVVKVKASKGQKMLEEMLKVLNADMVGEFSLTDGRMSRITKFMAHTLFDENVGGKYGNTHLALGLSYRDAYVGELERMKKDNWEKLGFNNSVVHTDIMATTDRKVTAVLEDGRMKVIYRKGKFAV